MMLSSCVKLFTINFRIVVSTVVHFFFNLGIYQLPHSWRTGIYAIFEHRKNKDVGEKWRTSGFYFQVCKFIYIYCIRSRNPFTLNNFENKLYFVLKHFIWNTANSATIINFFLFFSCTHLQVLTWFS